MARTVQECYSYIVQTLTTQFSSVGITINSSTWSKRNFIRLMCYTFAIAQSLGEQMWDIYLAKMQDTQMKSISGTSLWLQDRAFRFQYSASSPQYVAWLNGVVDYPVINDNLKLIKACSVQSTASNIVNIKVAKSSPLVALTSLEKTAAQNYFNTIGVAGVTYNLISLNADKIYIKGNIYYAGAYSAVIQAMVIDAINAYLENLSKDRFGGDVLLSDIKNLIRNVEGVNDVSLEQVSCRADSQALFGGVDMAIGFDEINRRYIMASGYLVQETTALNTFADTLTFIAE